MPIPFTNRYRKPPVQQIADVGQDFSGRAYTLARLEIGKRVGNVADRFASAISQRGQAVTQQFAFRI